MSDHDIGFLLGVVAGSITVRVLWDVVPDVRRRFAEWRRCLWRDRVKGLQHRLVNGDESVEDDLTRAMAKYVQWMRRARRHG